MATDFPTGLDSFTNPVETDNLNAAAVPHWTQHANKNDAIEALQVKVGIDGSAVTTSHDYKLAALAVLAPQTGSGTPEAVVTASPGTTYWDTTGKSLWIKDTGTGNTGWYQLIS